jgi:hypothetical protein
VLGQPLGQLLSVLLPLRCWLLQVEEVEVVEEAVEVVLVD